MRSFAICFLAGICSLGLLPDITIIEWHWLLAGCPCLVMIAMRLRGRARAVTGAAAFLLAGLCWAGMDAARSLSCRLAEHDAGRDFVVTGKIVSLPRRDDEASKFLFELDEYRLDAADGAGNCRPGRFRLSWYYPPEHHAGERWQLRIRLKPPHGFANPGGFDYERWLFGQDIHATGYVRRAEVNRLIEARPHQIDVLREAINGSVAQALAGSTTAGIVQALATGNRDAIGGEDWDVLIRTGTNHLVAISGLHIGLAAGFGYLLVFRVYRWFAPGAMLLRLPAQDAGVIAGIVTAAGYALLAGMSIPTRRALIMLACFVTAWLLRRHSHPGNTLALALVIVLLVYPGSVHAAGFWFSFAAVLAIVTAGELGLWSRPRWQQVVLMQFMLSVALAPLSLYLFQQTSLVSPLANLVMVPLVGLLVVPLILLALMLLPLDATLAGGILSIADFLLSAVWPYLAWLASWQHAVGIAAIASPVWLFAILAVAMLSLVAYRRYGRRQALAVIAAGLLTVFFERGEGIGYGDYTVDILDVGQGTAVVVRTAGHTLVYDTGARFGDRLDAGESVVVPFLRSQGIHRIDTLLISHGDNDHIGGATSVLASLETVRLLGRQIDELEHGDRSRCTSGMRWQWDGVDFELLHPDHGDDNGKSNNQSCVLRIAATGGTTLLPGDIEKPVESSLVDRLAPSKLAADLLLVPHHGSRTSSTSDFIEAVSPVYAVITAGYRNRYRLPANEIVEAWCANGSEVLVSGHTGAIHFEIGARTGVAPPAAFRRQNPRYWRHSTAADACANQAMAHPVNQVG